MMTTNVDNTKINNAHPEIGFNLIEVPGILGEVQSGTVRYSGSLGFFRVDDLGKLERRGLIFTPLFDEMDSDSTRTGSETHINRGYQRRPEDARIRALSNFYLNDDKIGMTTPVVFAVRKNLATNELRDVLAEALESDATEPFNEGDIQFHLLSVIDGNHRSRGALRALSASEKGSELRLRSVTFLAIHHMDYPTETEVFNKINTTPKRLPKALVQYNRIGITGDFKNAQERDHIAIALQMNEDAESAWFDQVNIAGQSKDPTRPVTLEGLRRATESMFDDPHLTNLDYDTKYALAHMFWLEVRNTFSAAWHDEDVPLVIGDVEYHTGDIYTETQIRDGIAVKVSEKRKAKTSYKIKDLVGVAALAKLGGAIMGAAQVQFPADAKLRHEFVRNELTKIATVNWNKSDPRNEWMNRGHAGFAGQKGLFEALNHLRTTGKAPWDKAAA